MVSYKLFAKQGDLLTAKVNFAVNPSNTAMLLGSGVSMAFKRSCGVMLEKIYARRTKKSWSNKPR